jgi:hypothetical protein
VVPADAALDQRLDDAAGSAHRQTVLLAPGDVALHLDEHDLRVAVQRRGDRVDERKRDGLDGVAAGVEVDVV